MLATLPPINPAVATVKTEALTHTLFGRQLSAMNTLAHTAKTAVGQ